VVVVDDGADDGVLVGVVKFEVEVVPREVGSQEGE